MIGKETALSFDSWTDGGLTPEERAAGVWSLLYGKSRGYLDDDTDADFDAHAPRVVDQKATHECSERYRSAVKIVAGLASNRDVKLALLRTVHQDSMRAAIGRYMAKEQLPTEYAALVESPECIRRLVEGIFFRICKLKTSQSLTDQIIALGNAMRSNADQRTAYDRVGLMQQFIHRQVDQGLGLGAAQAIPVIPMKNALSAARLHLGIADLQHGSPAYIVFMDALSKAAMQREYDEPRESTAPYGKQSWPKWRVRHLQPFSYFFQPHHRRLLVALGELNEKTESDQFMEAALQLYARNGAV